MKTVLDYQKSQDEKAKAEALKRKEKYLQDLADKQKEADEAEKRLLQDQLDELERLRKKRNILNSDPIGSDGLTTKQRDAAFAKEAKDRKYFQEKTDDLTKKMQVGMSAFALKNTETALTKEYDAKNKAVKNENKVLTWLNSEKKKKIDENLVAVKAGLELAAGLVDEQSAAGKGIAVTLAVINTYQGATAALATLPPPISFIAAAATIAAGIMNVNKILSTQIPSAKGEGSVVGGGAASVDISAPTIPSMQFSDSSMNVGGNNPNTQLIGTLAQATNRPIKAFVVSQDMSSTQALDRRTNKAATF
jgi:hypothetical protein